MTTPIEQKADLTDFERCTHPDCGRFKDRAGWSCSAMRDNACARRDGQVAAPAPQGEPSTASGDDIELLVASIDKPLPTIIDDCSGFPRDFYTTDDLEQFAADAVNAALATQGQGETAELSDAEEVFEAWAATEFPMAVLQHSLGAYSRNMKRVSRKAWDAALLSRRPVQDAKSNLVESQPVAAPLVVLEALREKAAQFCQDQGDEWDSDKVITDKNYAAYCADLIRSIDLNSFLHLDSGKLAPPGPTSQCKDGSDSQVGNFGDSSDAQIARMVASLPLPNYSAPGKDSGGAE